MLSGSDKGTLSTPDSLETGRDSHDHTYHSGGHDASLIATPNGQLVPGVRSRAAIANFLVVETRTRFENTS